LPIFFRARALAGEMLDRGGRAGDRAVLVFPPGIDFIVGLFAASWRIVAVRSCQLRRQPSVTSSANIIADCTPRFADE
jgi:acyl-CoA synthetase (AMP-forming)/AMP-acid ligase II